MLAAAVALVAMLAAAPGASAATFAGGPFTVDFKSSKLKVKMTGQDTTTDTKTKGTFPFTASGAGTVTLNTQPSGTLTVGSGTTSITLTHANKKKIVLKSLTQKLSAGKGQITAKVNGKGGAIAFFDEATTNKLKVAPDNTALALQTATLTLNSKGAAAMNKAFGLKAPARGKPDLRLKAKRKMGTVSFNAARRLTVTGGQTTTLYNKEFYDKLQSCDISLGAVAPSTPIARDEANPDHRGGVTLPIRDGSMNATTRLGTVNHNGGTVLTRPGPGQPGNTTGKPAYNSELTDFSFSFDVANQILSSFVKNLNARSPTGNVTGTVTNNLGPDSGTVTLQGELILSPTAASLLSGDQPPLGASCSIPEGSKIGAISMQADVN